MVLDYGFWKFIAQLIIEVIEKCCDMLEIVKKLILTVSSKIVLYSYFCMIDIFY